MDSVGGSRENETLGGSAWLKRDPRPELELRILTIEEAVPYRVLEQGPCDCLAIRRYSGLARCAFLSGTALGEEQESLQGFPHHNSHIHLSERGEQD
jgi:hypothetical protein